MRNALSSSTRDTVNFTTDLWPPQPPSNTKNNNVVEGTTTITTIEPVLIVTTVDGEPCAFDPKTLQTKGRLADVGPKLKAVFPEELLRGTQESGVSKVE